MNRNPTTYTPLEAFALFQELNKNFSKGLVIGTFGHISDTLKKTPLIYEQAEYDADRLSPESLQGFALHLLREERKEEKKPVEVPVEKNTATLSPNSRKRKLQSPPLVSYQDEPDKLSILVDKLYTRFRDGLIREIREDERRFDELQRELAEIERGEWDERLNQERRADSTKNGAPAVNETAPPKPAGRIAPSQTQTQTPIPAPTPAVVSAPAPVPTPTPTPVPVPSRAPAAERRVGPPQTPQPLQERKPTHPIPSPLPPSTRPPSETRITAPDNRPQEPARPISGATPVLQHPQTAHGYPARQHSTTPQPPVTDGLQRPDVALKGRSPAPVQSNQPHTPTATPTPAPALKWEPPYQPPHQPSPQPSPQLSHLPPHQSPHQQHPPPQPPIQHQPPHQTPIPSPRPPYGTGVARPPTYPSQPQTVPPQLPQNYASGRQTPGQYHPPQHRPSVQTSAPASPSVLLPPQSTGQIPPSLQSLPLNTAPDGTGQQAHQRRPASVPIASSPGPSAGPSAGPSPYPQHQGQHAPTQTPIRPPITIPTTHSAASPSKPPLPSTQWGQTPGSGRSHISETPIPAPSAPQQSQAQPASRLYNSPYNQQVQPTGASDPIQRPRVPPLQTPASMPPQLMRPSSAIQPQTPLAVSPHIIRGHGTKWTSTPTPATPRMEDVTSYFETQSPVFEPISPPPQTAQLPKTSPESNGKKDVRKPAQKTDGVASRPRGRPPRASQKTSPLALSEETPAEPDLLGSNIKNEEATPRALEDIGDAATADESVPSQVTSGPSQPSNKRKRQESPPNRAPPTPASHVLWTRSFNKISQSALDQIISHRHANMFAHPVKPKTAPGYFEIVLRPQDLKGIQKAITAGSKAAAAAVATMADVDPSATNVWIPISVDLVPPRGIINIAQLERELVHMFANAIMYNPDPYRGFGPSFLRANRLSSVEGDGEDYRGYEVDENGVVKDTRSMFSEVEKLLSDLRNEVERNAPPPTGVPPSASRSMSVAGGETNTADDDVDELAGDGNKRRRIRG